ncbi:MAG: hypothetical protein NG740_01760 [Omnitrophica bacterium]|nr:hypothetical protein [Candidatus Omnitrophota bacterium]
MKIFIPTILILCFFLAGCEQLDEGARDMVLEKDPSFRKVLNEKKRLSEKIVSLRENFKEKKDALSQKIRALKEELEAGESEVEERIASIKKEIGPKIEALRIGAREARVEYGEKARILKASISKLANIQKLLKRKKEFALSGDEISIWNKRSSDLEDEIDTVKKDLDRLRNKTSLLKIEIKILNE